jgi:transcriptional antiterminator RfaH
MPWYALYTKPKNEIKVTEKLLQLGIDAYCPTISTVKQWSDRKKKVLLPLLSSYIFVHLNEKDRNTVFSVPGIVRYVYWLGRPAVIRDIEIQTLKDWLAKGNQNIISKAIEPGDKIKIESGVFAGQEAVLKEQSSTKMWLVLESLGILLVVDNGGK